ncbi:MAG: toxin-antitoxin system HicB family antitoxin [Bifidobacteriaceae bacterium]|jgi:hypothetical protein|nr:toxin-antitoxin system HicB family antitoxin [Bifidobacteriaceae bacterium]
MDLAPYVEQIRQQIDAAAEAGGPEAQTLAERLAAPLEAAVRLTLLEALSAAASEITVELAPGSVELRLRGREPEFAVSQPASSATPEDQGDPPPQGEPPAPEGEDGGVTRTTLRLPEHVKQRVEEAAALQGVSVNAWLARAVANSLSAQRASRQITARASGAQTYRGWVN